MVPPLSLAPAAGVKAQCSVQNLPRSLLRPSPARARGKNINAFKKNVSASPWGRAGTDPRMADAVLAAQRGLHPKAGLGRAVPAPWARWRRAGGSRRWIQSESAPGISWKHDAVPAPPAALQSPPALAEALAMLEPPPASLHRAPRGWRGGRAPAVNGRALAAGLSLLPELGTGGSCCPSPGVGPAAGSVCLCGTGAGALHDRGVPVRGGMWLGQPPRCSRDRAVAWRGEELLLQAPVRVDVAQLP